MRTDILLDDDFNISFSDNDFLFGESDEQHVAFLIFAEKGEIRESPWVGFRASSRLHQRTDRQKFLRELELELENDGYNNAKIELGSAVSDFKITLE